MTAPELPEKPRLIERRGRRWFRLAFASVSFAFFAVILTDHYLPGFFKTGRPPVLEFPEPPPPPPPPEPEPEPVVDMPARTPLMREPQRTADSVSLVKERRGRVRTRKKLSARPSPKARSVRRPLRKQKPPTLTKTRWWNPRDNPESRFTAFRNGSSKPADESGSPLEQAEPSDDFAGESEAVAGGPGFLDESDPDVRGSAMVSEPISDPWKPVTTGVAKRRGDNLFPELREGDLTPEQERIAALGRAAEQRRLRQMVFLKKIGFGLVFAIGFYILLLLLSGFLRALWKINHPDIEDPRKKKKY